MVGGPDGVEHFDSYPIAEVTDDEIQGFFPLVALWTCCSRLWPAPTSSRYSPASVVFELPSHGSLCTLKSPATKRLESWLRTSSRWVSRYSRRAVSWLGVEPGRYRAPKISLFGCVWTLSQIISWPWQSMVERCSHTRSSFTHMATPPPWAVRSRRTVGAIRGWRTRPKSFFRWLAWSLWRFQCQLWFCWACARILKT